MKKNFESLEDNIKNALENRAEGVSASDSLLKNVYEKLEMSENREVFKMKKIRRIAIGVCAAVLCLTTAAVGGGIAKTYHASSDKAEAIDHIPTDEEMIKAVGYAPKFAESLGGYAFESAQPVNSSEEDENGSVLNKYRELDFFYDAGEGILSLTTHNGDRIADREDYENHKTVQIGDVTAYVRSCKYMAVPPDYEPTEKEKAAEEAGELMIGYGSDEVEVMETHFVSWVQEGITYEILSMGLEISEDEIVEMAREVIEG